MYKTDCKKCKNRVRAGIMNSSYCSISDPAELLTEYMVTFLNKCGCMSFVEKD